MASYVGKIKVSGSDLPVTSTLFGICTTVGSTVDKTVTCANFDTLIDGVCIKIRFPNGCYTSATRLNVNSTGLKYVRILRANSNGDASKARGYDSGFSCVPNSVIEFMYNSAFDTWDYIGGMGAMKSGEFLRDGSGIAPFSRNTALGGYMESNCDGSTIEGYMYCSDETGRDDDKNGKYIEEGANGSHIEGYTGDNSQQWIQGASGAHIEGFGGTNSAKWIGNYGDGAHVEGYASGGGYIQANGKGAHAEGYSAGSGSGIFASANGSHAEGTGTLASAAYQHVEGAYNVEKTSNTGTSGAISIVGKGSSNTSRANAFRVTTGGCYGAGAYNSSGADYAELFEWKDSNINKEDRVGRFVNLDGEHISIEENDAENVLGIVSGNPTVVGDVYDDQWQGMFLTDIYGRPIYEEKEEIIYSDEFEYDEEGNIVFDEEGLPKFKVKEIITKTVEAVNPNYSNEQEYVSRTERPEWAAIGLLGKLIMIDDGTSEVNGYVKPTIGGIATKSDTKTKFRVMKRIDSTHIRILVL